MLEDQVAFLLQRYLGNYVKGLSREALKISVWKGDVELTNMQLKPEALNALKLPIKVKAGFLGSVKLKVPWSRLGQDPVLVYLDRIFLLAEPETQVEGSGEDVQEIRKNRIRDMEVKLLEKTQYLKGEVNQSWLGSLINTIIGNLKLSISNIHIRYEDLESNPGHPFAAGVTLEKLSAFTVDDSGKETFVTGGALDHIQKSVELESLALYFDSDISPWHIDKPWEDLLPSEWSQVFKFGTKNGKSAPSDLGEVHTYILQPVSGNAKYIKLRQHESVISGQPLQKAAVHLDDVTICLSKDGYRDIMKLADNFAGFNQRLKYAHYRPSTPVSSGSRLWWKYAYRAITDEVKKASGRLSWEHVLRYARLRKKYISLYASLLKADPSRAVVDDNKEIEELDHELDIELIVQWRMVAHKFVERSVASDLRKQRPKKSWWSFGWSDQSPEDDTEALDFSEADWEQLNRMIGYKESDEELLVEHKKDVVHTCFDIYMRHNASKLMDGRKCLAELSCEGLTCSARLYPEAKVFDMKLGSYYLSSPNGLLAVSATKEDSLAGTFWYKPFDMEVDWSMVAKASPCYMTYLKDSFDQIMKFFESNAAVSQKIALETAAAVQMTIDGVKRTAQEQMTRALKDQTRFFLDLDIAAPKITIPTDFCPDTVHPTRLLLDLGNLVIRTEDDDKFVSTKDELLYLKFDLVLSDVSAFLVDGDYHWGKTSLTGASKFKDIRFLPVIDRCGVVVKFQQIKLENPLYPSARLAVWIPSLAFHFSPARYHRLMQIVKIFSEENGGNVDPLRPWSQADFEGWLSLLNWKGVANREAVWQRRYLCLVGPFLYILESPDSKSYKQCISVRGKHIYKVPAASIGNEENVLALSDPGRSNNNVVQDANALILQCESDDSRKVWQSRLQGAAYRASASAPIASLSETSSDADESDTEVAAQPGKIDFTKIEKIFIAGVLDELKICFYYTPKHEHKLMKVLLSEEKHLFEFRAIGGRVEVSMKGKDMFVGTVLKSLEIEDLVCGSTPRRRYLAKSFIGGPDNPEAIDENMIPSSESGDLTGDGDDKFYEAPDVLTDADCPTQANFLECVSTPSALSTELSPLRAPSFSRVSHLLPDDAIQSTDEVVGHVDELDSFVKAQIIIYDQSSLLYNKIDKRVAITLATLSFFCRRPTVIAIMDFGNSITIQDESSETFGDSSPTATSHHDSSKEELADKEPAADFNEPVVKGLLGTGKSRVIFLLSLNMNRTQIFLLKENETKLATLSQHNLLTEIKVFPSSFSISAALGNLRISDDSLTEDHMYFWACDMRNPGGSSFVELLFSSYSIEDDDYRGYDFSLYGQLSEVRIVYLNRFIQEVVSYFVGLTPETSKGVVKLRDQVTNSEKWFTKSEIEGSPALKLDLSLTKPIILMPRSTSSPDYLKLDVVHITIRNTFQWFGGNKDEINAVHMELMTILIEDINLNVGTGAELGESIVHEVNGVSIVIQRSLRDLLHQVPSMEAKVEINVLKAALSNKEYEIITECAQSNISETANVVPPLTPLVSDVVEPTALPETSIVESEGQNVNTWVSLKVIVAIELVELSLHSGVARDAPLATVQVSSAWILFKSNTVGDSFLSATLKSFNVFDDREGIEEQFRLAIGKPKGIAYSSLQTDESRQTVQTDVPVDIDVNLGPTMLIFDMKSSQLLTSISLCIQRPQLLVALDFLLGVVEFFVPSVRGLMSGEEEKALNHLVDAIILDKSTFVQPSSEFSLSPQSPLVLDDERFDHFVYDGKGGTLYLKDRRGSNLSTPCQEPIIYVGSGKRLQFKNVVVKDGQWLDSCIVLGTDSSYSATEADMVLFETANSKSSATSSGKNAETPQPQSSQVDRSVEYVIELQAIGPELTFYNASKDVGESLILSNKLLHAQLDAFSRIVMKGDTLEMSANALGFTMESNGIRVLEPFDTSIKFSRVSGKTNMHISVSDIFLNFSFSILRLFLAVEEDLLAFLRTSSKKMTMNCSEFDKVGKIESHDGEQVYVFWRPRAPPGFASLGDYLTPIDKPPTKGVLVVNMNLVRVKRPVSFKLVWPVITEDSNSKMQNKLYSGCSVWFPVPPNGYIAMGCVVSSGMNQPPLSSSSCILASLVSPCPLRDCIHIYSNRNSTSLALWRVDNSVGTFLPTDQESTNSIGAAYEIRHLFFGSHGSPAEASINHDPQSSPTVHPTTRSEITNSGRRFEPVASFQLVWWNQNSNSRKKLSIWRPVVPQGMVYFGDIAVKGFEPPNACIVLQDLGEDFFKTPLDFQLVGQIKKQRGIETISFWLPQAPPGFVALGCIACKGSPKNSDLTSLRCIRSDMVAGDQFSEESIWDTSDARVRGSPFSIWTVGNELGTFLIRNGYRRPPKRFALKLADLRITGGPDDTVIDAEISTFSVALFDDFGGLMVPLCNLSLSGIGFSLHGRPDYLNATISFSLAARSYNDKNECWEPVVEPVDGFLRYQYDFNSPAAASQIRLTSIRDLNMNISVSNANMILQAYASWNNFSQVHQSCIKQEAVSPEDSASSIVDVHHRRNYFIIPQNELGQDIFIRATEIKGLPKIIRMPTGDMKALKVPVSKNMMDSHLRGDAGRKIRTMVTFLIAEAEFQRLEGLTSRQYAVAVRLTPEPTLSGERMLIQQSARTCGRSSVSSSSSSSELESVKWSEAFFFKVDSVDYYILELLLIDMGKGDPVGFFSAPLNQVAVQEGSSSRDILKQFSWIELAAPATTSIPGDAIRRYIGKLSCAILLSTTWEVEDNKQSHSSPKKPGFIQISPSREGPWTSVRLNYAAPAACWRFGNNVVASEVNIKDGNRCVNIRSLVSVRNSTEFTLDLCLKPKSLSKRRRQPEDVCTEQSAVNGESCGTDEFLEVQKYDPGTGWISLDNSHNGHSLNGILKQRELETSEVQLPSGWEWVDDWHVDKISVKASDGWVYAPDYENLKWPESFDHGNSENCVRARKWIRSRKKISDALQDISIGLLKPGDSIPLPLSGLTGAYTLHLRPIGTGIPDEYAWSSMMGQPSKPEDSGQHVNFDLCVSALEESDNLVYCSQTSGTSSSSSRGVWFCLQVQATEIAKDIHGDPIQDWSLVVKSPISIANYLPLKSEYSVLEMQENGHFTARSRGIFSTGKTVNVYSADITKSLLLSLFPQKGWLPSHEAVVISNPLGAPVKALSLRSSVSGRVVKVILEQNHDKERPLMPKIIRVYAPFWFSIARCPPLKFRIINKGGKSQAQKIALTYRSRKSSDEILDEITGDEFYEGLTMASTLNFKQLGLSVFIANSGEDLFGPVQDLSPLGDMDGSVELSAYDSDSNCMRLFISSKPCPYQSVPTKVISIRPFMTFTNRVGENIFIKLSANDAPKTLLASDSREAFSCRETTETNKLQVRLEKTQWSCPVEITKEDTFDLVLRDDNGNRRFLRTEVRGFEEGSRFIVVFRLGSAREPIRLENRTAQKEIRVRQSGFGDDYWIPLAPLSATRFSWEDPYGPKLIDIKVNNKSITALTQLNMEAANQCSLEGGVQFSVVDDADVKIARFKDTDPLVSTSGAEGSLSGICGVSQMQGKAQDNASPLELIIEFGVVGVSVIDHRPRELSYLYLERVFISYSSGYDGGTASRFKLILGNLQIDNQLPLALMPVLLAPEQTELQHPVFKMTLTIHNEKTDGIQVYPYVYIRVTDKCWRLNVHEPIIWAAVDFYNNLQLDRLPESSDVTQVDPEIRIDLIDVSEIRIKISFETAPAQRPHGVLGVWSPVMSAIGNAFKIQVHLRKVMHRGRFMRKSSVVPAITNRIWRDLIHNPLHLLFSVDVLGMTSSTLASLSKGFAELSTDGQFLQLRSKQVWSRRITGVGDGLIQGTEAFAQGVAFGVSGVVRKPVESARQNGVLGLANGLGRAFVGFIVQPVSGALDFLSLTVDGIGASCSRCFEVLNNRSVLQRIRNPRAIHSDGILREYSEREAAGQMILHLAEASHHFGCTEIFKEPSKFALTDYYEEHFSLPQQRIALITNKRIMLLQCLAPHKMDRKPCKIMWDVPWDELLAIELAKAGHPQPCHLILHLKTFKRSDVFARVIKCHSEEAADTGQLQAIKMCSLVRKMWKGYQSKMKSLVLKVPSSKRQVHFSWSEADARSPHRHNKSVIMSRELSSSITVLDDSRFVEHSINFTKIWCSEHEPKGRCTLCQKKVLSGDICSIWRPTCPLGYVSIGDIARVGTHPPNVAAVYRYNELQFAPPIGYDLVWRNCIDDYKTPASIWLPRAPEGYTALGCIAVAGLGEPEAGALYCVADSLVCSTDFEDQKIWSAPDSYPWACHIYQVQSDALHFVALRQPKEELDWKPKRVMEQPSSSEAA